jgi:hypothetical protein
MENNKRNLLDIAEQLQELKAGLHGMHPVTVLSELDEVEAALRELASDEEAEDGQ